MMSTTEQNAQLRLQLQQEIQQELITANQLLRLISVELHQIKTFTSSGGEFESNIKQNASLITTLANLQNLNLENIPPKVRKRTDAITYQNQKSDEQNMITNESNMDDSQ